MISVDVGHGGGMAATPVLQLYLVPPGLQLERPPRTLGALLV